LLENPTAPIQTSDVKSSSANESPINNSNGSIGGGLDWLLTAAADIQKPRPKFEMETQPVSYDELVKWNEIIDKPWSLCATKKIIKTCSINGDKHFLKVCYNRCNDRALCPRCSWYNARREAWTTWYWLKNNLVTRMPFKVYLLHIVLTVPKDLTISDKQLIKAVHQVMTHQSCQTTFCYVIQNNSSSNPLVKHRHVHLLALNIGMVRGELGNMQFRRLRPYFNVDRLRRRWNKAIGYDSKKNVDLHVSYCHFFQKGQAIHWLSYMYRYNVWDVFKHTIRRGKGTPFILIKLDGSKLKAQLSQQKKRVTWVGFLASTKRYASIKWLGEYYTLREIREKVKEDSNRCPYKDEFGHVCGALLKVVDELSLDADKVLALAVNIYERQKSNSVMVVQ